jgi:hypothetical protein
MNTGEATTKRKAEETEEKCVKNAEEAVVVRQWPLNARKPWMYTARGRLQMCTTNLALNVLSVQEKPAGMQR